MITIKSEKKSYGINFPTSVEEITPEMLDAITKDVKLPEYYCIIALAFQTKLFDFCAVMNNTKNSNMSVTPLLAKVSVKDVKNCCANVGDQVLIDRSSLERGIHYNAKTMINASTARNYFNGDNDLTRLIMTKSDKVIGTNHETGKPLRGCDAGNVIILEFKICPIGDISAYIPVNVDVNDPFLYVDAD